MKKPIPNISNLISYEKVFHEKAPKEPRQKIIELLEEISFNEAIYYCCKINTLLTNVQYVNYETGITDLIGIAKDHPYWEYYSTNVSNVHNKLQTYALMPYILSYCIKNDAISFHKHPQLRMNFLKALILAGDEWILNAFENDYDYLSDEEIALTAHKEGQILCGSKDFIDSFAYSIKMYLEYIKVDWPDFNDLFIKTYGITPKEFISGCLFILVNLINKTGLNILPVVGEYDNAHIVKNLLDIKSIDIEKLKNFKGDIRKLFLNTPIISDFYDGIEVCTIFDPVKYFESIEAGFIFDISKKCSLRVQTIIGYFGKAFERYVTDKLNGIHNKNQQEKFITETELIEILNVQMEKVADGYIDFCKTGIVIEIKSNFVNDNSLDNAETYTKCLEENYRNACKQIVSTIERIEASKDSMFNEDQRIIPLLIVRDNLLCTINSQQLIVRMFSKIMRSEKLSIEALPLIIMTSEEFERLIGNEHVDWLSFLMKYDEVDKYRQSSLYSFMRHHNRVFDIVRNKQNKSIILKMVSEAKALFERAK